MDCSCHGLSRVLGNLTAAPKEKTVDFVVLVVVGFFDERAEEIREEIMVDIPKKEEEDFEGVAPRRGEKKVEDIIRGGKVEGIVVGEQVFGGGGQCGKR
ncbi:hypothetical protein SLEP1_g46030 [Rubroshorea leprosula]|uniref:Uncharacterized protein n=1 Tax=Rubroshorea leprosula TaxID=152421 RepID=A0AAV5LNH2_9ROSI|nr:hypothetical protein SLEP1_g46030 [Rubroshorea leprosula]